MEISFAQELIAWLESDPAYFNYYPDRYAVFLLGRAVAQSPRLDGPRSGPYAALLRKPRIKALLANHGGTQLSPDCFRYSDCDSPVEHFRLSLGLWSGEKCRFSWAQTSRPGVDLADQDVWNGAVSPDCPSCSGTSE